MTINCKKITNYILCCFLVFATQAFANTLELTSIEDITEKDSWIKLLHYKKEAFDKYQGLIKNKEFYIAADGYNDPLQELKEEIKEFTIGQRKCDFPARFNWLKKHNYIKGNLNNCKDYQQFIQDVRPKAITVLFTNAFMSNPASLFGHTLIRVDTARKGTQMLAHGANFGANSGLDTGVIFALKGLFGGYMGSYQISPYWNIINTYNNIENRDIWEYKLNLSNEEIKNFIDHLYEMKDAQVQYFFLSKNCSYMLLELIEAVKPDLDLTSQYSGWAIPLDTLKTIHNVPDLVKEVNYRPARYTKIQAKLNNMSDEQYSDFVQFIRDKDVNIENLSQSEQSEIFSTAYEYYQYEYIIKKMELSEYRKKSFAVLRKRSKMPQTKDSRFSGENPVYSHNSAHVTLGGGVERHKSYETFTLSPAYTSFTDDNYGMINGAGVAVLENKWRYYNQKHKFVLQHLTGLEIVSLVPADRIFKPYSYRTDFNIHREFNPQTNKEGYVLSGRFGMGQTYNIYDLFWFYGMFSATGQYGGFIPGNQWIGAIPEIGIFKNWSKIRLWGNIEKIYATRRFAHRLLYETGLSLNLNRNIFLNLTYNYSDNQSGHNSDQIEASLKYYF